MDFVAFPMLRVQSPKKGSLPAATGGSKGGSLEATGEGASRNSRSHMQIRLNHTAARARGRRGGEQIIPSPPFHLSIVSCGNKEADFNLLQLLPGFRKCCACQATLLK